MDPYTLTALEFDKVVQKASTYAISTLGRAHLSQSTPLTRLEDVERLQREVSQAREILACQEAGIPLHGIHDIRASLSTASIEGAILDGKALHEISCTIHAGRVVRETILSFQGDYGLIKEIACAIAPLREVEETIVHAIGEEGEVLDRASPALFDLRRSIEALRDRLRDRLQRLTEREPWKGAIEDPTLFLRNDRYVLLVTATMKGRVRGIVHDRSDSGASFYMEPIETFEDGNELAERLSEERHEVRRILRELTARVGAVVGPLERNLQLLARLDSIRARAAFSLAYGMREAFFNTHGRLRLVQARHPILLFHGVKAVPLDLRLDDVVRTIAISGPNAGGKTVALKVVGLLQLMAQAGFHVPVFDGTEFPLVRKVFADIGDDQSIERSLSTFTSHMTRIARILAEADDASLVLLDELGTGTDPGEGGALASAVLLALHQRGAKTIATSHLDAVKALAISTEGMENASVQFDLDRLAPTYVVRVGVPGQSHALDIAAKCGVDGAVLAEARSRVGEKALDLEAMIRRLQEGHESLEKRLQEAARARDEADRLAKEHRERVAKLEQREKDIAKEMQAKVDDFLARSKERIGQALEQVRRAQEYKQAARAANRAIDEMVHEAHEGLLPRPEPRKLFRPDQIQVGDTVKMRSFDRLGVVRAVHPKRNRVTVDAGGVDFEVDVSDLEPAEAPVTYHVPIPDRAARPARAARKTIVPNRLQLIGMRVEEALKVLSKYLDNAYLTEESEFVVVHGYGSGRLRDAVVQHLQKHPLVESLRPGEPAEGGGGVTVVSLRQES